MLTLPAVLKMILGIGSQTAGSILEAIAANPEPLAALAEIPVPAKSGEDWPSLLKLLERPCGQDGEWPGEIAQVREWYEPRLDRIHEHAET